MKQNVCNISTFSTWKIFAITFNDARTHTHIHLHSNKMEKKLRKNNNHATPWYTEKKLSRNFVCVCFKLVQLPEIVLDYVLTAWKHKNESVFVINPLSLHTPYMFNVHVYTNTYEYFANVDNSYVRVLMLRTRFRQLQHGIHITTHRNMYTQFMHFKNSQNKGEQKKLFVGNNVKCVPHEIT